MTTKTITLALDAYEKLRGAKRGGESFSEVVRRAVFADTPPSGNTLQRFYRAGGSKVADRYLEAVEEAVRHDSPPDDPWD